MEMGQAAGMDGDVARKAKVYYPIIRKFQNNHMALEKVWNKKVQKPFYDNVSKTDPEWI